jgi:hypothetical protein
MIGVMCSVKVTGSAKAVETAEHTAATVVKARRARQIGIRTFETPRRTA